MEKIYYYNERKANKGSIWILYIFLGWSYGSLGRVGTQILFYLTFAGLGFWGLVRLFTLNGAIKEYNRKIAVEVGLTTEEISKLGLM